MRDIAMSEVVGSLSYALDITEGQPPGHAAHHEKLDGSGYPFGLDADALDLPMRVLAVADIYEALTALRPYRGPMAPADALAVIHRDVPGRLDARVVAALEDLVGDAPPLARAA